MDSEVSQRTLIREDPLNFYRIRYEFSTTLFSHERVIYSFLDLLGDVGGFNDALRGLASLLLATITFQPMTLHLVKKLFQYQTSLPEKTEKEAGLGTSRDKGQEELKLSLWSRLKLTVLQHLPCDKDGCLSKREKAFFRAADMLKAELNIVNLIKEMRVIKASLDKLMD